jgi:aspartyl-tRNA(Asn)/glutamyl-tRNA(Gln) amidotransferase subunit A
LKVSDITSWTLTETLEQLKGLHVSEQELVEAYSEKIRELNPKLNAFLEVIDNPAEGLPIGIKDVISTKGIKTTAGSKILENYVPPFNATVVERLIQKKVSIMGKNNCDEFAMGSSGENSSYSISKNPWDMTRIPGGSSSGSAVAVASDMCLFSIGTDTGGSVRQPAAMCGVTGLKPSYGDISRYGLISMASSLDCPGIFAKSVEDCKTIFEWIAGGDMFDANSAGYAYRATPIMETMKGKTIGLPKEYFGEGLDENVKKLVMEAVKVYENLGAQVVEISLPHTEYAIATYYILMASEVSSNLGRFDAIRFGKEREFFGSEVKRRIMLGTFALSTGYFDDYFIKAAKVRRLIQQDFNNAFSMCDMILGPVSPTIAWKIGEKIEDPLAMYLSDIYTIPASLAGLAGISIPCGFSENMPVGLQIITPRTEQVLDYAHIYQANTDWHTKKPDLVFSI